MTPNLNTTLGILGASIAVIVFANWQLRRPFERRFLPILPWFGVQFLAAVIAIVMLGHLVSLLTGQEFRSRYGY